MNLLKIRQTRMRSLHPHQGFTGSPLRAGSGLPSGQRIPSQPVTSPQRTTPSQLRSATTPGGVISSARDACAVASLIVIDDATAHDPCSGDGPAVITKRDLARYGSAEVAFRETSVGSRPIITYSISKPYRPWHEQRRYSREARGMPPYQRRRHTASTAKKTGAAAQ